MKTLILVAAILITGTTMAQTFNDTLFYNSGNERPVHIVKETKSSLSYRYKKDNGWIVSGRTRKSVLRGYVIYDKNNHLVASEKKPLKQLPSNERAQSSSGGGNFAIGFLTGVVTTLGGLLLLVFSL